MKYRKSRPPRNDGDSQTWLTTYGDMVTNILVFFVLIFSASSIDEQKFRAISESFQNRSIFEFYPSMIPFDEGPGNSGAQDGKLDEGTAIEGDLDYVYAEVSKYLQEHGLEELVGTKRTEEGLILVLPEQILFNTGEARILPDAIPILDRVSELLEEIPNMVRVEGHTDSRPIHTHVYPSNWELSGARASSVIRYFIDEHNLDPERFMAVGFGETRPVAPNDGPENWAKNRRVEIIILDEALEQQDQQNESSE
mgnify:CR=1 FL=1